MFAWLILAALAAHFLGDFVLQTSWMAQNKGKELGALLIHIGEYTCALMACSVFLALAVGAPFTIMSVLGWCGLNSILHFVVDFISSRVNRVYGHNQDGKPNKIFWMVLGADQLAHQACLILTILFWIDNYFV